MAHGVTLRMLNIRGPAVQWIHKHAREGGPKSWLNPTPFVPYVNPARDLKPGRRLRVELRSIPLCDSADGVVRKGSLAYRGEEYSCPGGAIINGFAVPCWSLAHDEVLTRDQVREVAA